MTSMYHQQKSHFRYLQLDLLLTPELKTFKNEDDSTYQRVFTDFQLENIPDPITFSFGINVTFLRTKHLTQHKKFDFLFGTNLAEETEDKNAILQTFFEENSSTQFYLQVKIHKPDGSDYIKYKIVQNML